MGKVLHFTTRGQDYHVNESGDIYYNDLNPSGDWKFLGVSHHHWSNHIDVHLDAAFDNPKSLIGGLVWDLDHGTTRQWGGSYNGKLPRITAAYVTSNKEEVT